MEKKRKEKVKPEIRWRSRGERRGVEKRGEGGRSQSENHHLEANAERETGIVGRYFEKMKE